MLDKTPNKHQLKIFQTPLVNFIRMEMGVSELPAAQIGVEAKIEAL